MSKKFVAVSFAETISVTSVKGDATVADITSFELSHRAVARPEVLTSATPEATTRGCWEADA